MHKIGFYEGAAKNAVHQMKFHSDRQMAQVLGDSIGSICGDLAPDYVTYVPTDNQRIRQRGFDHARHIAVHAAQSLGAPLVAQLTRVKLARQVGLGRTERKLQMKGVFMASSEHAKGKTILLIDDVLSTGATLESAAGALKDAGAKRIYAAVVSHNR